MIVERIFLYIFRLQIRVKCKVGRKKIGAKLLSFRFEKEYNGDIGPYIKRFFFYFYFTNCGNI